LVTEHPALPFHESLFETDIEDADVSEQATDISNHIPKLNQNEAINIKNNSPPDMTDELDNLLNKAMRKTKLAQQRQFPPAPLWQAVFHTLKGRVSSEHAELVGLPTKAQYESIAQLLGQSLGQLGQIENQTLATLAEMLSIEATAVSSNSADIDDATK